MHVEPEGGPAEKSQEILNRPGFRSSGRALEGERHALPKPLGQEDKRLGYPLVDTEALKVAGVRYSG